MVSAELEALRKFKQYVHARLDAAGVPADPDSPHKAEGCRIGGRLDLVLGRWAAFDDLLAACEAFVSAMTTGGALDVLHMLGMAMTQAAAAIAKAKGG